MVPVAIDIMSTPHARPLPQSRLCGVFRSPHDVATPSRRPSEPAVHEDLLRVLWIDDEVQRSDVAVRALELNRFTVECARTGEDGVRIARHRIFDVILLDLRLPDTSGLDVLELFRDSGVTAPTVILTGFADVETAVVAMKLGAADYWTKPLDVVEMAPLLRRLVLQHGQERSPVSPQLTEGEWLRIRCDRFGDCLTRRQLIDVLLATLLDRRLTLPSFFGCAEALRIVMTASEPSLVLVASDMRSAILQAARMAPPQHPRLRDAIETLERGGGKLSQRMFAGRVGLSRTYLSHLLTVQTGRKASDWCHGAVMRSALREVLRTNEQISQIAYAAGYKHAGQFDHDFRMMFGAAPTEVRHFFTSDSTREDNAAP